MATSQTQPQLLIAPIISLFCVWYPAPWHFRNRNVATLSMLLGITAVDVLHIVNSLVWWGNADVKAAAWCDISIFIFMFTNYSLPLSHLILARQLDMCTSMSQDASVLSPTAKRRGMLIDLSMATAVPLVCFLLTLSTRATRFDIIEGYGPMPGVRWDAWGVIWVAIVPIVIALACLVYTCKACWNILQRRQAMLSIISRNSAIDKSHLVRLLVLAISEVGVCMSRAWFNMFWGVNGLEHVQTNEVARSMTAVRSIELDSLGTQDRMVLDLSWFTVLACSVVFFLCFATSYETKRFYWAALEKVCPPVKTYRIRKEQEKTKYHGSSSSAA